MIMNCLREKILSGLTLVPTCGSPGTMVILNDKAEAVFTGNSSGEVFLAAAEYGNGRVFICTHDKYYYWLDDSASDSNSNSDCDSETEDQDEDDGVNFNDKRIEFMNNVKKWLIKSEDLSNLKMLDVENIVLSDYGIDRNEYKLVKWCQDSHVSEEQQIMLLEYVNSGGSLIAAVTPWGFLSIYPSSTLNDLSIYRFLRKNFDIILTNSCTNVDSLIPVDKNLARYSNFSEAVDKITGDFNKLGKYCSTIECALSAVKEEGLIPDNLISLLGDSVKAEFCKRKNDLYPLKNKFIQKEDDKNILKLFCKCLIERDSVEKAPCIEDFPGDFNELPNLLTNVEIKIETIFEEWISSGYYLPAGVKMNVKITSSAQDLDGWFLRVGAHSDDVSSCDGLNRWPILSIRKSLKDELSVCSPFGGLIFFQSPEGGGKLSAVIGNVVQSPFIDVLKPETIENWNNSRVNAPGLWAELAGEHVIWTCPSSSIRHITEPLELLKFWDQVIKSHHKLRGTNPYSYRRERVVNDKQPVAGYMHAGYPVVTHLDICNDKSCAEYIFDIKNLKKGGCWGLFHEFGHNMQRDEWTFEGSVEVTVNIFSMHAMEFVIGNKVVKQPWIMSQRKLFKKFFKKQPTYDDWQGNCYIAIMTFAQLIKYFGWEPMYKFMADYENDIKNNSNNLPKNNQEKIDQWVIRYSHILQKNIKPHFEMWGLPVTDSVAIILQDLPEWSSKEAIDPDVFYGE